MIHRYKQGCVDVIQLEERMTRDEMESVQVEFAVALQERMPQVVVDFRRVRLIDSAGLELLVNSQIECLRRGGAIRLASVGPLLRDVLRVTGLDQELSQHIDVASATGAFAL